MGPITTKVIFFRIPLEFAIYVFEVIFYGFYHGISASNHQLVAFVFLHFSNHRKQS